MIKKKRKTRFKKWKIADISSIKELAVLQGLSIYESIFVFRSFRSTEEFSKIIIKPK